MCRPRCLVFGITHTVSLIAEYTSFKEYALGNANISFKRSKQMMLATWQTFPPATHLKSPAQKLGFKQAFIRPGGGAGESGFMGGPQSEKQQMFPRYRNTFVIYCACCWRFRHHFLFCSVCCTPTSLPIFHWGFYKHLMSLPFFVFLGVS